MAEKKIFDTGFLRGPGTGNGWFSDASVLLSLVDIPQGNTDITRIGDKVTGTSLQFNILSYPGDWNDTVPGYWAKKQYSFRVLIFIWKDDTVPTELDILDALVGQLASGVPLENDPTEFLSHDKKVKRKIIYDKTFCQFIDQRALAMSQATGVQLPFLCIKESVPLTQLGRLATINFVNATTTGINKIWLLIKTNVSSTVGSDIHSWYTKVNTRYNFIDM